MDPLARSEHLMGTRSLALAAGKYSRTLNVVLFKLDRITCMQVFLKAVSN